MKNKIRNCLATTGLSLILLAVVATLYQGHFLFICTIYQTLLVNIIIHLGLAMLQLFESNYFIIEISIEVLYILIVLILSGYLFNWYSSIPIWVFILLGIAIYFIGSLIDIFRIKNDIEYINNQLKHHKLKL